MVGNASGVARAGQAGGRGHKKTGVLQGMMSGGGLGDGGSHQHDSRGPQQNNVSINHQSNLQQFAQQQILNSTKNKGPLNENLN